jgi:hypothetical protein
MRSLGSVPMAESISAYRARCSEERLGGCLIFPLLQKYGIHVKVKNGRPGVGAGGAQWRSRRNQKLTRKLS